MKLDFKTQGILERAQVLLGERGSSQDRAVTRREMDEAIAKAALSSSAPRATTIVAAPAPAAAAASGFSFAALAADVTNANAIANTMQDIPGLQFSVVGGETYWFRFAILYTAAATTTGARFSIDGPAAPTMLAYFSRVPLTTTTATVTFATAYDAPSAAGATSPVAGGAIATIEGFIQPSVSGGVIARFASEVAGSAIVAKAGSFLQWRRTL